MTTDTTMGRRQRLLLAVGVGAVALVVTACGGGSSSSTGPTASSGTLRRVEVHVDQGTTAQAPRSSLFARLASLVGWPQVAEAHPGLACMVTLTDGSGATVAGPSPTDGDGRVTFENVPASVFADIDCGPHGHISGFPISGPDGAAVTVRVTGRDGDLRVRARDVDVSPSVSVSGVSQSGPSPSQSSDRSGSNSGSG